ncbi:twin-arginine translocase TatA/TatE family subunit [Cryobacterium sp. PH29-G1]|nr:twin-arginine translocase TatA/TatE family subunit [Cryobacterium sp. PH29-G1]MDJ0349886.1 twin-arginine translocase TatA/TatE family subunit [Cryobacterium sp. PH29-G1]
MVPWYCPLSAPGVGCGNPASSHERGNSSIILFVVLLLCGAAQFPGLSRSLGQSMKVFRNEFRIETAQTSDAE